MPKRFLPGKRTTNCVSTHLKNSRSRERMAAPQIFPAAAKGGHELFATGEGKEADLSPLVQKKQNCYFRELLLGEDSKPSIQEKTH